MLIYKATNLVNNKVYVGQTRCSLAHRKHAHLNRAFSTTGKRETPFYNALRKYGEGNFIWDILEHVTELKCINDRETYWISQCKSMHPAGYNLVSVGNNGLSMSSYTTENRRIASLNRGPCSESKKLKISSSLKKRYTAEGFSRARAEKISNTVKLNNIRKPSKFLFTFRNEDLSLKEEVRYITDWHRKYSISSASAKRLVRGQINKIRGWTYAGKRAAI
jgi:group I intron endonuclease